MEADHWVFSYGMRTQKDLTHVDAIYISFVVDWEKEDEEVSISVSKNGIWFHVRRS